MSSISNLKDSYPSALPLKFLVKQAINIGNFVEAGNRKPVEFEG